MNNKGVGAIFCLISALLMGTRYLTAAIYIGNTASWDEALFEASLKYVGSPLTIMSIVALVIGVIFIALGFVKDSGK